MLIRALRADREHVFLSGGGYAVRVMQRARYRGRQASAETQIPNAALARIFLWISFDPA